jgi:hypothetical protein
MIRGDLLVNDQSDLRVTCLCDTSCELARKSRAGQVRYRERPDPKGRAPKTFFIKTTFGWDPVASLAVLYRSLDDSHRIPSLNILAFDP